MSHNTKGNECAGRVYTTSSSFVLRLPVFQHSCDFYPEGYDPAWYFQVRVANKRRHWNCQLSSRTVWCYRARTVRTLFPLFGMPPSQTTLNILLLQKQILTKFCRQEIQMVRSCFWYVLLFKSCETHPLCRQCPNTVTEVSKYMQHTAATERQYVETPVTGPTRSEPKQEDQQQSPGLSPLLLYKNTPGVLSNLRCGQSCAAGSVV